MADYVYDINGTNELNLIKGEVQIIPSEGSKGFTFIVPKKAPFHEKTLVVKTNDGRTLTKDVDYELGWYYLGLSEPDPSPEIYMAVVIKNKLLINKPIVLDYGTVGAEFILPEKDINVFIQTIAENPIHFTWDELKNRPGVYSSDPNLMNLEDISSAEDFFNMLQSLIENAELFYLKNKNMLDAHINDTVAPHDVSLSSLNLEHLANLKRATLAEIKEGVSEELFVAVSELKIFADSRYLLKSQNANVTLNGPTEASPGDTVTLDITNFDSFSQYSAEMEGAVCNVEGNKLKIVISNSAPSGLKQLKVFRGQNQKIFNFIYR